MPTHRSRAIASAHAAGTPTHGDSHHRIHDAELTHTPEHEHMTLHRCRAFSLHAPWPHSQHSHLTTTTPPLPPTAATSRGPPYRSSRPPSSPPAPHPPHPPTTSTSFQLTCTHMQHSTHSPLHPLHCTPTALRRSCLPHFTHGKITMGHVLFNKALFNRAQRLTSSTPSPVVPGP